jgi:hypothetical protein
MDPYIFVHKQLQTEIAHIVGGGICFVLFQQPGKKSGTYGGQDLVVHWYHKK